MKNGKSQQDIFKDRLDMQNSLKEAKQELNKLACQNKDSMIYKSYEEMQKHREQRGSEEQLMILKPLLLSSKEGSVLRCKKIVKNTNLEEMNWQYGLLTWGQQIKANKEFSNTHRSNSPMKFDFTEKFHHIEGKIAKQNRIEMIKEYSRIFKRVKIGCGKDQSFNDSFEKQQNISKYRQAVQKVQVLNHRKSGKNILPVLRVEKNDSVESILSDLNYSRLSLEQDISYLHIPQYRQGLQQRLGGGFTRPNKAINKEYFLQ